MTLSVTEMNAHKANIQANAPGAIGAYYGYLATNTIPYGELAGDVAAETGFFGEAAREFFEQNMHEQFPGITQTAIDTKLC